jgi:hypothetical protein
MLLELAFALGLSAVAAIDEPAVDVQMGFNSVKFASALAVGSGGQADVKAPSRTLPAVRGSVGLHYFRAGGFSCSTNFTLGYRLGGDFALAPSSGVRNDSQTSVGLVFRGEPISADWSVGYGVDVRNDLVESKNRAAGISSSDAWRAWHRIEFRYHYGKSKFWKAQPFVCFDLAIPHAKSKVDPVAYYRDYVANTQTRPLGQPLSLATGAALASFTRGHMPGFETGFSIGIRSGNRWWR